ncbi:DNA primase [Candidatus Saccharibacteria bacterium]|nr:DNA primase [Candidatus Saccharibacteria bacterium]
MNNAVKEEIKARLPVEDVISRYLELKRAGRNLKALSPFTNERTPSFMVSPERNVWHDYSSGKGGDIFSFVMEVEGVGFIDAMKMCAGWAGVNLDLYESKSDRELAGKTKRLKEVLELSAKYYQHALTQNPPVIDYAFYKRNLNKDSVKNFRIGYAPATGDALIKFLASRGVSEQELSDAGLLNRRRTDIFRERLVIPLSDQNGNVMGFVGRIIDDKLKDTPKYLNSPETLLYNKSRHIFGLHQAKRAIIASGYAILVEGNMDVVSSHQAGVPEAVATAGTAMTAEHLKALARFSKDIRIAYDGDAAGLKATERAIILASGIGVHLRVIADYGAKDPDDLIQQDPKLWQEAVLKPQPAMEWLMGEYAKRFDVESGAGKREYADAMLQIINSVPDEVERETYRQSLAERLKVDEKMLAKKAQALIKPVRRKIIQVKKTQVSAPQAIEEFLSLYAWIASETIDTDSKTGATLVASDLPLMAHDIGDALASHDIKLVNHIKSGKTLDVKDDVLYTRFSELVLRAESRYDGWSIDRLHQEMRMLTSKVQVEMLSTRRAEIMEAIEIAETEEDEETLELLLVEQLAIDRQIVEIKATK